MEYGIWNAGGDDAGTGAALRSGRDEKKVWAIRSKVERGLVGSRLARLAGGLLVVCGDHLKIKKDKIKTGLLGAAR